MRTMPDSPHPLSRLYAGPFPALEDRLLSRLPEWAGRRPGSECVLIVPSNELREHLLRRLASRWVGFSAGSPVLTLYDFALRLLKHRGIFPREIGPARMAAALAAAVRECYARGEGDFASIAGTPGFLPALARTLADLEEGWLGEEAFREAEKEARRAGDAGRADRWREWRRLAAAVRRALAAMGGMSRRAIFQDAVDGFEQPGYPFRIVLYGFYDFTRLQWILVEALLESGLLDELYFPGLFDDGGRIAPAFAYAAPAWDRLLSAFAGNVEFLDDRPAPAVAALREEMFRPLSPAAFRPAPTEILSAPHGDGEMRLAARRIRDWVDRRPDEELLVVSRRFEEGTVDAWERMAAEYRIATAERQSVPLSSVPPVRVLIQMIEASEENFPRRKVIDILSSPYRRHASTAPGAAPRPDIWDVLSRELLVVAGNDWETRLFRPRSGGREEETDGERAERRTQLALLRAEVRALRGSLAAVRGADGYAALASGLRALLLEEFRIVDDKSPEGERDRRAVEALFALLDDIALTPRETPWPGPAEALSWFRALLRGQRLFLGQRGGLRLPGAVVAGDVNALRGVTADRIVFLSVNEDVVPAQVPEDPLLPDEDREALNRLFRREGLPDPLSLARRGQTLERLLFALPALSARKEVVFSVLRADAEGQVRRPSRYLLHLLSRFAGPAVYSEDWAGASGAEVIFMPRSPLAALAAPGPLSPVESALALWRDGRLPGDGARDIPWRRIAGTLREWGARRRGSLFPRSRTFSRGPEPASASELDELVRCPYRYLLRYRLGLSPVTEPEEAFALTPADLGRIVHDILRRMGEDAAAGRGWGDPAAAAREAIGRYARENPTGLPGLFRLQCLGLVQDAAAFAAWERRRQESPGARRVEAVEREFEVEGAGGVPPLRGRVDRIDRGPAGDVEIIDYKYRDGRKERAPLRLMRCGLSNQLPVYLVFAGTLASRVGATLLFIRNDVRPVTVEGIQWAEVREDWAAGLSDWLAVAGAGLFPPLPHHLFSYAGEPPPRYCLECPFQDHCRVSPVSFGTEEEQEELVRAVSGESLLRVIPACRPGRGR